MIEMVYLEEILTRITILIAHPKIIVVMRDLTDKITIVTAGMGALPIHE